MLRATRAVISRLSLHERKNRASLVRARWFSEADFVPRGPQGDPRHLREVAHRVIGEYTVGDLPQESWLEAEEAMTFWSVQRNLESVGLSFGLFDRLLEEKKRGSAPSIFYQWLDTGVLERMVNNWRVVWWNENVEGFTPQQMLDRVLSYNRDYNLPLSDQILYLILDADYTRGDIENTPKFGDHILDLCIHFWKNEGNEACKPTTILFNLVMRSWAKRGGDVSEKLNGLMEAMLELEVNVDSITYDLVLEAWSQAGSLRAALKAQELLKRMIREYQQGDDLVRPDALKFTTVIAAWARSGAADADVRGEALLEEMKRLFYSDPDPEYSIVPAYNALIQCYANAGSPRAIARAEELYRMMERSAFDKPDYFTYMAMIAVFAKARKPELAQKLLDQTIEKFRAGRDEWIPDSQVFSAVMNAWGSSNHPDKLKRVEQLFLEAQNLARSDGVEFVPTISMFNALLSCLVYPADRRIESRKEGIIAAEKAEAILMSLRARSAAKVIEFQPNYITYTIVMRSWAVNGKDPDRAFEIFKLMIEDYLQGNKAARPDAQAYNTLLSSCVQSNRQDMPELAEKFLNIMVEHYNEGIIDALPNEYSYSTVLSCLAKASKQNPDFASRAQNLFDKMREAGVKPASVCYNALMNAWAEVPRPDRCEALLYEMYQDYVDGNDEARPTIRSFNTVLKGWAKSKQPEAGPKAEEIMKQIDECYKRGMYDIQPDVCTYRDAIKCHYVAKLPGSPQKAESLLREMERLYQCGKLSEEPKHMTYNVVRKAWKFSNEPGQRARAAALEKEIEEKYGRDVLLMYVNHKPNRKSSA